MSAPPGFNPDTSLLQQNSSAPIVPFRGGGTPVSLEAFYQAILKGQPETIRKALPESIADITNFAISVEDGKFVLKMKVKGKKKEAAAIEANETKKAIADVAALEAATEEKEKQNAIDAVAASEVATKAEAEEEAAKKKAEEEEILKKAREFLILEAARAFLRKERNNEPELLSSSQLVTPPSETRSPINKRAALYKAVLGAQRSQGAQGAQEEEYKEQSDGSSVEGENGNEDRSVNEFEANIELDDLEEPDQVMRAYEDATNNPPNLNERKTKQIKTLRKALTVIDAARHFARLGAVGKKRKIAEGKRADPLGIPRTKRKTLGLTSGLTSVSSSASSASAANVNKAARVARQLIGTRPTDRSPPPSQTP